MDKSNILRWALNFFELLACVTGFIFWNKLKKSYWKWMPVYLAVILIIELTAKYIREVLKDITLNVQLYRFIGLPLQFLFFFWLLSKEAETGNEKKWAYRGAIFYIICWIADIFYFSKRNFWFSSFSYTIGNIILVALIIRFLLKFINSNEILNYKTSMLFWVTLGILVFYLGTLPFYGLRNTLYYNYRDVFWVYTYVQLSLDCLMYLLFTIAFIWGKPK